MHPTINHQTCINTIGIAITSSLICIKQSQTKPLMLKLFALASKNKKKKYANFQFYGTDVNMTMMTLMIDIISTCSVLNMDLKLSLHYEHLNEA